MALLGIDLGGTKLALAVFSDKGELLQKKNCAVENRKGSEVGALIRQNVEDLIKSAEINEDRIASIGVSVPGISHMQEGTVWAPNIPGWESYPLRKELQDIAPGIPVTIDSDRACYILGESWKGNARGCRDAIFLSVGTGIGAGIMINNEVLRGSNDIAGCIGWMALDRPYESKYAGCGCFEYYASGEGIAKVAGEIIPGDKDYRGELSSLPPDQITSADVFAAYDRNDPVAVKIIKQCIEFWGMAVANLVSLFNPVKIIFGGGVFGPAKRFIPDIRQEAEKWAQPVSIKQVVLDSSTLGGDAGVYGAGFLALKNLNDETSINTDVQQKA